MIMDNMIIWFINLIVISYRYFLETGDELSKEEDRGSDITFAYILFPINGIIVFQFL